MTIWTNNQKHEYQKKNNKEKSNAAAARHRKCADCPYIIIDEDEYIRCEAYDHMPVNFVPDFICQRVKKE